MYRGCDFGDHGIPARTHHMQACWYSMHRHGIYASLSCVPCAHTVSGYPAFSTDAASASSFRISSLAFPDAQRQSGLHGSPPHSLRLPLRSSCPVLCSGVLYKPIFPVTVQIHEPSGISVSVLIPKSTLQIIWSFTDVFVRTASSVYEKRRKYFRCLLSSVGAEAFLPCQFLRRYSISV